MIPDLDFVINGINIRLPGIALFAGGIVLQVFVGLLLYGRKSFAYLVKHSRYPMEYAEVPWYMLLSLVVSCLWPLILTVRIVLPILNGIIKLLLLLFNNERSKKRIKNEITPLQ